MLSDAIDKLREMFTGTGKPFDAPASGHKSRKFLALPNGYRIEPVPQRPEIPEGLKQSVVFDELDSFGAYLNRYGTPEATVVFLQQSETTIAMDAVLDFHRRITVEDVEAFAPIPGTAILPQWCNHRAAFRPVMTAEWKLWTSSEHHKKAKEQEEFARFLRENRVDVFKPNASDLIETCMKLEMTKTVKYKKHSRESNGDILLSYSEENKPEGTLEIPEELTLLIAPYQGETWTEVLARLRVRLAEGACWFSYELDRPHKVLEACAQEMREQIAKLTAGKFPIYSGRPS